MGKVVKILEKILDKMEPDSTIELEEIVYSKKHGHEICIMRLIGKNIFPKMTADEILSNPKARAGLSKEDLIKISQLDIQIKFKKNRLHIVEFDRNGTVVLEDEFLEKKRYSEKVISQDPMLLNKLNGSDSYRIGYRVGIKDGLSTLKQKQNVLGRFFGRLLK